MEKCVCQICSCGTHKCGQRLLKDVLGQNVTNSPLPSSETKASYRLYNHPETTEIIRPLQADWHLEPLEAAPEPEIEECVDASTDDNVPVSPTQTMWKDQKAQEVGEPIINILVPQQTHEASSQTHPVKTPIVLCLREPPNIPPLMDTTVYKNNYKTPPLMSQLPNCAIKRFYEPPDLPFGNQSVAKADYKQWDLKSDLKAPNPRTGSLTFGAPEDNLKPYNVPMTDITTFLEAYGTAPLQIAKVKFELKKNDSTVSTRNAASKCQYHSAPDQVFFNRAIFTTSYQAAYGPPCMHLIGPGKKIDKDRCPAASLNYCYPSNNYEFVASCCGHDIFLDKNIKVEGKPKMSI